LKQLVYHQQKPHIPQPLLLLFKLLQSSLYPLINWMRLFF